jgi:hypothetical protein
MPKDTRGTSPQRRRPPWRPRIGDSVELRRYAITFRIGTVETVMPDGTGFWLAPHGADGRQYVHIGDEDLQIFA